MIDEQSLWFELFEVEAKAELLAMKVCPREHPLLRSFAQLAIGMKPKEFLGLPEIVEFLNNQALKELANEK